MRPGTATTTNNGAENTLGRFLFTREVACIDKHCVLHLVYGQTCVCAHECVRDITRLEIALRGRPGVKIKRVLLKFDVFLPRGSL